MLSKKRSLFNSRQQDASLTTCTTVIGTRFEDSYQLERILGTGAFSTVREARSRSDGFVYAVKCVESNKLTSKEEESMLNGASILRDLQHVHILCLYDFFVEPNKLYFVMERAQGGELYNHVLAKGRYNDDEARHTCIQLLEAVEYLHDNCVAHRDLKPENLLLSSDDDDEAIIKIADFGFAATVEEEQSLTTMCGTLGYVAPEVLRRIPYDERADMWSVGVILFFLLSGSAPMNADNKREMYIKTCKGDYGFHEPVWDDISNEAIDLVTGLLSVDPSVRLSALEALESPWIQGTKKCKGGFAIGANLKELNLFKAKHYFQNTARSMTNAVARRSGKVCAF